MTLLKSGERCWTTTKAIEVSGGKVIEEAFERFETTGRCSDPDDV